MKKRLILSFLLIFFFFTIGAAVNLLYIGHIVKELKKVIELHKVSGIRHQLIEKSRIVQTNVYTVGTAFGEELDIIVNNVMAMDNSIKGCVNCHHKEETLSKLMELQKTMEDYKTAISYLVTTTANEERIGRLKMATLIIGDSIMSSLENMISMADTNQSKKNIEAINKINKTWIILFITLSLTFVISFFIATSLTRQITRPLREMLKATKEIEKGEFGKTISYEDNTEFGLLAKSFNSMSSALKVSYENIIRQQHEVEESERKFRTLSEFSQDWEYWISEKSEIIFMSPSCERITGYSQYDFINNPRLFADIVHPEDQPLYKKHLELFNTQELAELQYRIITKNGEIKWLSHICNPIWINNEFKGRRVSNRDITDSKRLEEQLIQSQKMESLGLFAGGIAHDMNNILTVIDGYSRLMKTSLGNENEKLQNYIQNILDASKRAQELTSSLLAFSRKKIAKPQPIKLNSIIKNITDLLKRLIGEDIELKVDFKNPENEMPVLADPHQIEQIFMNLATNARDAMPNGGSLTITTTPISLNEKFAKTLSLKPGDYMLIDFSDTGIGIDKSEISHIFEPFYTTKEKGKGTGLGLSIVYGIVKQHEGLINVYSEKGLGSTFKIYLPVFKDETQKALEKKEKDVDIDLKGTETILIAEDDPFVREYLNTTISEYGYNVLTANDGEEAIKIYEKNQDKVDIVVLDVIMPKKNGKEVYNFIKKVKPNIKAIFMSGYTQDILTSKGIYEEGLEFVAKPIDVVNLLRKVRYLITK